MRASIDAGPITMGEVLTVLPFQNTLSTFRVSGATLMAALENGVSQVEDRRGRFSQVAGMRYSYDPSAEPGCAGARGDHWRCADGAGQDCMASCRTTMCAMAGTGYAMFRDADEAYDFGPDVADVLAEYLIQNTPFTPMVDDRVRVVSE